jgi:hypothetical protein
LADDAARNQTERVAEIAAAIRERHIADAAQHLRRRRNVHHCAARCSPDDMRDDMVVLLDIGHLDTLCEFCGALHFAGERVGSRAFSLCCQQGKVRLPDLRDTPAALKDLFSINNAFGRNFLEHIHRYNSGLAFASMCANVVVPENRGPFCYKLHEQVYHRVGGLLPGQDRSPCFSQLYIIDSEEALCERM